MLTLCSTITGLPRVCPAVMLQWSKKREKPNCSNTCCNLTGTFMCMCSLPCHHNTTHNQYKAPCSLAWLWLENLAFKVCKWRSGAKSGPRWSEVSTETEKIKLGFQVQRSSAMFWCGYVTHGSAGLSLLNIQPSDLCVG